jgi:hypothetical protein
MDLDLYAKRALFCWGSRLVIHGVVLRYLPIDHASCA